MSNEIKKDESQVPAKQPLPAKQEVEEVAETDLDDVAGGWCLGTTGCGGTCAGSCGKTSSGMV